MLEPKRAVGQAAHFDHAPDGMSQGSHIELIEKKGMASHRSGVIRTLGKREVVWGQALFEYPYGSTATFSGSVIGPSWRLHK